MQLIDPAHAEDEELLLALRLGDERAYVALVRRYGSLMQRVALSYVRTPAVAEEVVQETWLGVVRGIGRFEGRSSLKTWLFRILVNRARTAGVRERRQIPFDPGREPAVPPERFGTNGAWVDPPSVWVEEAEARLAARQTVERITACLAGLPEAQRQVVVLRDFEGLAAQEVCALLDLTDANQRVLLHRGRSRIRSLLERELGKG
jgi:RNA polymerase sigma-70 factor (ECF subfamily)